MPDPHNRPELKRFWDSITPVAGAYRWALFSYFAPWTDGVFSLAQGRLFLFPVRPTVPLGTFQSDRALAGIVAVDASLLGLRSFISEALAGSVQVPGGSIVFAPESGREHSLHFSALHHEAQVQQRRESRLWIQAGRRNRTVDPELDWALRAACPPFQNSADLCAEFGVGPLQGDSSSIEVIIPNVVAISSTSQLLGSSGRIRIELAAGLSVEPTTVTIRVVEGDRVSRRGALTSTDISWESTNDRHTGEACIEVPPGSRVDCTVCYGGIAFSHWWLVDPATSSNPRRAVTRPFDRNPARLKEVLHTLQGKHQDQGGFEEAVTGLLWLLGFAPVHLGQTHHTQDGPDIVAFTPKGNVVLVECTTGMAKSDKVALLAERANALKMSLSGSSHANLRVLPVFVTNKRRVDVLTDFAEARKRGVVGVDIESLDALVERSELSPTPDRLFEEGEELLRANPFEELAPTTFPARI